MADDDGKPTLARREPGTNLRGKAVPTSGRPGLSEIMLRRAQAAVQAERERPDPPSSAVVRPEPLRSEESAGDPPRQPENHCDYEKLGPRLPQPADRPNSE